MAAEVEPRVRPAGTIALPPAAALTKVERAVIVVLVAVMLVFSTLTVGLEGRAVDPFALAFDLFLTCLFIGYLFAPALTTAAFGVAVIASFFLDLSTATLIPAAVATALVVRTCRPWVIGVYVAGIGISIAVVGIITSNEGTTTRFAIYLLLTITAATIGLALRLAGDRERRLEQRLLQQARNEADVRRAERLRIADELHDVVAHDLTAIAMQARLLERQNDPEELRQTRQAISDAARKALVEMRSVIDQAATTSRLTKPGGFAATVDETRSELVAAGRTVDVDVDPAIFELPRLLSATLTAMVRESVTNILKHSVSSHAVIDARVIDGHVEIVVRNGFDGRKPSLRLPSSGYGTLRLSERVQLLGGEFTSGVEGRDWVARMRVPLP